MAATISDPRLAHVLEFCAEDPVERVFLEDVAGLLVWAASMRWRRAGA